MSSVIKLVVFQIFLSKFVGKNSAVGGHKKMKVHYPELTTMTLLENNDIGAILNSRGQKITSYSTITPAHHTHLLKDPHIVITIIIIITPDWKPTRISRHATTNDQI